jgi:hypothetical protein
MLEMADEVNILDTHDIEWCEGIVAIKGWKEKKDKLDIL